MLEFSSTVLPASYLYTITKHTCKTDDINVHQYTNYMYNITTTV